MKIKYNIPMINEIKNKLNNLKDKLIIKKNNQKIPIKYYTLLILMLSLGVISLMNNIKKYNKINKENYTEYSLNDNNKEKENLNLLASNQNVYLTAESSINTADENILEDETSAVETISNNYGKIMVPVSGEIIKEYAMEKLVYSKTLEMWNTHPGIDIKASIGTKVMSASEGKVLDILIDEFYGKTVIVSDNTYIYKYSNLDDEIKINIGDYLNKGDVIGSVGTSSKGELQDDSHLHFEVLKNNSPINPLDLLDLVE